jgi:hypothetical protein
VSEYIDGDVFDVSDGLNDQASADEPHHSGRFYQKLAEEAMVHLLQVPLALALLLQLRADDPEVVRHVLVLVLIPEHHGMEVEHGELKTLSVLKAAYILRQSHEVVIQDD